MIRITGLASILLSVSFFATIARAQVAPVTVDLSTLPVIQKLEKASGWSRLDSATAVNQIQQYLKAKGEYDPTDCRFELSDPIRVPYKRGEVRSDVENSVRRSLEGRIVQFGQYEEWSTYPAEAPGFQPSNPANPDWIAFLNLVLPEIEKASASAYPSMGLRTVEINGYQTACADIKLYLQSRFKIEPGNVSCVEPRTFETLHASETRVTRGNSTSVSASSELRVVSNRLALLLYKLGYPHANGVEYRTIKLIDCSFKVEAQSEEQALENTGPKQPGEFAAAKGAEEGRVPPNSRKTIERKKPLTPAELRRKSREHQEALEAAREAKMAKLREERLQRERDLAERAPKYVSPADLLTGLAVARTEMGKKLVTTYAQTHGTPDRDQPRLDHDEKRLEKVASEMEQLERQAHEELMAKDPAKYGELLKFELDPEKPFDKVSVIVDVPLYPEELARLEEEFEKQNPGWMVGCRVRTLVRKDKGGSIETERTTVECLVPRFRTSYAHIGNKKPGLIMSVPYLGKVCKEVRNSCGIADHVKMTIGIRYSKLQLFKPKAKWETREGPSALAHQARQVTKTFEITGGLKGRILCAFTKKPINGANALIHGVRDYGQVTGADGAYLFNPISMKNLDPKVFGSHRMYHPNSKGFPRLKIFDISDIGDLELEPKRVTIRGKVAETFKPRYGSGVAGLVIQIKGYPQFNGVTQADGSYEIKNVPAILTDLQVDDPSGGHKQGALHFELNPDQDNEGLNVAIEPNLTIVKGRVHISNGRGAPKMRVQIPGHPEMSAVTGEDGEYELRDVPHNIPGLQVFPDPSGDYDGKSEAMKGLNRYQVNEQDIEVHYNRCDISGKVVDLVTLAPIANAKVWIEGGGSRFSVTTDESGNYEMRKVPISSRRVRASTTDKKYFPAKPVTLSPVPAEGLIIENQDIRMVPKDYTDNRIVIVLTWNKKQPDLDSQLYVPGKIRLYFANHSDAKLSDKIGGYLDVDDTGYGGRETTIIELEKGRSKVPGLYRFMVYQFASIGLTFQQAGAEIDVYKDGALWQHLTPPPGPGLLWYALAVDDRNIQVKNLLRNYPEFREYAALSKEFAELDRKLESAEAKVTEAKRRYESAFAALNQAKAELQSIQDEQAKLEANPPAGETPEQLAERKKSQAAALVSFNKKVSDAQRASDAAAAEQGRRIADHDSHKARNGVRAEQLRQRLEILGQRMNDLLNNPQ